MNSAKILNKFGPHKLSPKFNPICEKRVINFKLSSFCPVNFNQQCRLVFRKQLFLHLMLINFCCCSDMLNFLIIHMKLISSIEKVINFLMFSIQFSQVG